MNELDDLLARFKQEDAGQAPDVPDPVANSDLLNRYKQEDAVLNAFATAHKTNPDEYARLRKKAIDAGMTPEQVDMFPEEAERRARYDQAVKLAQDSPKTAKWLSDEDNAKLGGDNADNLSGIEQLWRSAKRGWMAGLRGNDAAAIDDSARILNAISVVERGGKLSPNDPLFSMFTGEGSSPQNLNALRAKHTSRLAENAVEFNRRTGELSKLTPGGATARFYAADGWGESFSALLSDPFEIAGNVATESLGIMAPGMPLIVGGGLAGGTRTMATMVGATSTNAEYSAAIAEYLQAAGVDVNSFDAVRAAVASPEFAEVRRKAGIKAATVGAFDAATAGLAGFRLRPSMAGNLAAQIGVQAAGGAAGEAGGSALSGQEINASDVLAEAIGEMPGAVTDVATMAGKRTIDRIRKVDDAERAAKFIENLNKLAAADKLLQRSPDDFQAFVAAAAEDGPVDTVFIDGKTLMQSGMAPQLAELSPAVRDQLDRAIITGGDIAIPVAEYAARIAPSELAPQLLDHLKTEPDGFTRAEAQGYMQNQGAELQAEVERILTDRQDVDTFRASQDVVKQDILGQLNTAGRFTPQVNEAYATLASAYSAVRAAQLGMTPEAFHQQRGMRVQGAAVAGQQFSQAEPSARFPVVKTGDLVDGRVVREDVPNMDSISATFDDYTVLDGVREVPMSAFDKSYIDSTKPEKLDKRTLDLADQIKASGEINPLIVAIDSKGAYIIEGGHRLDALIVNGAKSLPAIVVIDESDPPQDVLNQSQSAPLQTDTPAFKAWFGDSKVVDADGKPLVVYHGTTSDIEQFRQNKATEKDAGWYGTGIYMTADPNTASAYSGYEEMQGRELSGAPRVMPLYVSLQNPYVWPKGRAAATTPEEAAAIRAELEAAGHDGVLVPNEYADPEYAGHYEVIAFRPEQIKSAIGNSGRFDPADPNILNQSGYTVEQRSPRDDYTIDLFGVPEDAGADQPAGESAAGRPDGGLSRDDAPGKYAARTELVQENTRQLGTDRVTTPAEAAQALAYLGKSAVERFDALITDKDGKPLAIVGAFKGAISQTSVYQATLTGEAFRIKGAANIWLAHNHPGGSAEFSQADRNLHRMLADVFRGSEITLRGLYAIAGKSGDGREWVFEDTTAFGEDVTGTTTKPKKASSVPVVERVYTKEGRLGPTINSPAIAKIVAKDIAGGQSGVLMLTTQNAPVAFVPVDANKVEVLRKDGRMDAMYRALSVANAGAVIIVNNGDMNNRAVKNLAALFNSLDGRVLDVMETTDGATASWAETGKEFGSKTFFQPNGDTNRGAFSPATNTVTLLKNADLTTFLHEAAHYFFESDIHLASELLGKSELTTGEQQIVNDVSALLTWHGIQGDVTEQLRQWHTMDFEEQRSHHERTAESFEAYLFSGRAPSLELQPVFQRFAAWMVNVYKSLKDFLTRNPEAGKLNDEVRSVFDRMIATREEIALAEQARSMMPLFSDPAKSGMSPEDYAAYQAQGIDATNAAIQELQAKGLRDLQWLKNAKGRQINRLKREAKALRAEVEIEARREVMSQPVYQAWDFLTRKMSQEDQLPALERKSDPDILDPTLDSLFVAIAKLGGIKKDQVISEWGVDPKDIPHSGLFGKPVWRITDGMTLDGMAEALAEHGYLPLNEHGQYELNDLGDRFLEELSGNPQYSYAYQPQDLQPGEQIANPAGLGAGRIDLAGLAYLGVPDEVVNALKARKMTAKEGLHPDLVATMFDFSSGDELVRTLAAAQSPKEAITELTDRLMLERHGELATPEAIELAADAAIHNEARARFVATEYNALAKATGKPRMLAAAAKEYAAAMIARLKVRDIKPGQYANAEVRAAKASSKAEQAGDLATAAAEKRNQVINTYATRAAYDAQDEVQAGLRYLKKFGKISKALDPDYQDQIDAMLERFDLKPVSNKALDKRKSLAQWIEAQREAGLEPDITPELENEANRKSYKDMTVEEFRGLIDTVKQIEHLGRLKHKLLTAQDKRAFGVIVDEVAASIVENGGAARPVELETPTGIRPWLEGFAAGHRKLASLIRQMDGLKDGGPFWRVLVRGMNEAATNEAVMNEQATVKLAELYKPLLDMKGGLNGDKQFIPEINDSLTRGGRLSVALNWGNATNRARIMDGDGWSEAQVNAILKRLTRAEWDFVNGMWAYIDSYWPQIEAKEKRVTGRAPEKVKADPFRFTMANGETIDLTGGYYPIKYDSNRDDRAEKMEAAEVAKDMMRGAFTRSTTRRGHTKARVEGVRRPVKKTLDVITQHISEVTHDLAWHEWLIDANRLLNAKPINQAIREHYGTEVIRAMKDALTGIATADIIPQTKIDTALLYLRANVSRSTMGLSLTTAFLQPFGLSQSMVRIGVKPVLRGMARWAGDAARFESSMTWIGEKSNFMRLRSKTFNRELHEIKGRVSKGHSKARTIYDASLFLLMQKMQLVADVPTWIGAYEKARAAGQDDATAVALADQAVLDSQGGGQTKDMAEFQRKHPFLAMFYSYFSTTLNLAAESTAQTNFKNPLAVAGWASDMALLMVIPALAPAMLLALMRGEDCDDAEDCAKKLAQEQAGYLLNTMLGVRELSGSVAGYDYAGPPVGRVVTELGRLGTQVGQGEADEGLARSAISLLGVTLGIPTTQILRSWRGWNAWAEGDAPATSILLGPPPKD